MKDQAFDRCSIVLTFSVDGRSHLGNPGLTKTMRYFQKQIVSSQANENGPMQHGLCFIDVETTGPVFGYHEIIDLACVRASSKAKTIEYWEQRIRPRNPERITTIARGINGFSIKEWAAAPESSQELWESFTDFVKGCVPVCHNPSFERAFISLEATAQGVDDLGLDYHWIGTESLAWPLYLSGQLRKLSLSGLCEHFGLPIEPKPHGALNGAKACREVYRALIELTSR